MRPCVRLSRALAAMLLLTFLFSALPRAAAQTMLKQRATKNKLAALAPQAVSPIYAWTPTASMTSIRYGLATTVLNNKLYAIGGTGNDTAALNTVEVYDPLTNQWSAAPSMTTHTP